MSLAAPRSPNEERLTEDIDARIGGDHSEVIKAVHAVARRNGMPDSWVNERATGYIPRQHDSKAKSVFCGRRSAVVKECPESMTIVAV